MRNPFKKKIVKEVKEPKWTYGFGIDKIPDNKYLLGYTSINSPEFVIDANHPLPKVGDEVIITNTDHIDLTYDCIVEEVCYNYTCHFVAIHCKCNSLLYKK